MKAPQQTDAVDSKAFKIVGPADGLIVRSCSPDEKLALRRKRFANVSSPYTALGLISPRDEAEMFDRSMDYLNLPQRKGQSSTAQGYWAAIQVQPRSAFAALEAAAHRWVPLMMKRVLATIGSGDYEFYPVALTNSSRTMEPIYGNSADKSFWAGPFARRFARDGDWHALTAYGGFAAEGPRFQVEDVSKTRSFIAIDNHGAANQVEVNREHINLPWFGLQRHCLRARTVIGMGALNNVLQCFAVPCHDVMLRNDLYKIDIRTDLAPGTTRTVTADVSNFDYQAFIVLEAIARHVGGHLEEAVDYFTDLEVQVRSLQGGACYMVRADRAKGYVPQLMSGLALVSLTGKIGGTIGNLAAYSSIHPQLSDDEVLDRVWAGGDPSLGEQIRNQGDNQLWAHTSSDVFPKSMADAFQTVMPLGIDPEPIFAGGLRRVDEHDPSVVRFYANPVTFAEKRLCTERKPWSFFRPLPFHGEVERMKLFRSFCRPSDLPFADFQDQMLRDINPRLIEDRERFGYIESVIATRRSLNAISQVEAAHLNKMLHDSGLTLEDLADKEWKLTGRQRYAFRSLLSNSFLDADTAAAVFRQFANAVPTTT